jgi:hypothetical protein
MAGRREAQREMLECSVFLFRPAVEQEEAKVLVDVQRFFLVLKPEGAEKFRLLVLGRCSSQSTCRTL